MQFTDYNTAIRQACNTLAESGLRTVYYASGRSDRIEVAVRRALMTSVSQITQKISEQNAAEFGADGWEISAHVGARPSHAIYQERQYPKLAVRDDRAAADQRLQLPALGVPDRYGRDEAVLH
ncbi:MAG: phage minor capsid protein [Oscillospiraceae bacterium]|nr:phage minor capsid protein [Oscillospiraceae bacterium]